MTTTIARDNFIQSLVTSLTRELYIETEDHVWFRSNDLNVMIHAWYEDGFYSGGSSERLSPPWHQHVGGFSYPREAVAAHVQL